MAAVAIVLLCMDALEVFLHTMRLHWVEFMGKFYTGTGHAYRPFSFQEVFEQERDRTETARWFCYLSSPKNQQGLRFLY